MHRREFLIATSMGAAAFSTAFRAQSASCEARSVDAPADPGAAAPAGADTAAQAVVYDSGNSAAREFAQAHSERGAQLFAANECMVRLWRDPLTQIVSHADVRIAGLTTYSDFSMARECAREHGLRVLQESWHRDSSVTLVQWLIGV